MKHPAQSHTVLIMGAGLSGMAIGCELADAGYTVTIVEKNPFLGGRASNTHDREMNDPVPIGPHVFVTGYRHLRRFLKTIGAEEAISWERKIFLEIIYKNKHHRITFSALPDPFSLLPMLLSYPFMTWRDKMSHGALLVRVLAGKNTDTQKLDAINAYDYLSGLGVTRNAINKFWRFVVMSLLNVPIERCSAGELYILLTHFVRPRQKKFGFARVGLGDLYTQKARAYIEARGGRIIRHASVARIHIKDGALTHAQIEKNGVTERMEADIYVSTLTPPDLRDILPEDMRFSDFFRNLNAFEGVPYISVNLWFDRKITDKKFWALLNDEDTPPSMNTDFYDQSNIYATAKNHSFITSNIIGSRPYEHMTDDAIIEKTLAELKEAFPRFAARLTHAHVHRTPYAIYAPYPGMRKHKLPHATPLKNFFLAGDWTSRDLPQCMEAAVASGYACAEEIQRNHTQKISHSSSE